MGASGGRRRRDSVLVWARLEPETDWAQVTAGARQLLAIAGGRLVTAGVLDHRGLEEWRVRFSGDAATDRTKLGDDTSLVEFAAALVHVQC